MPLKLRDRSLHCICQDLLSRRHDLELLEESQRLYQDPIFSDFSVDDSVNHEHSYAYRFAGRSNTEPAAGVRSVHCASSHYVVLFGKRLLHTKAQVRKTV